ncbi:MAG: Xaa-Pro aminopeptidase [Planctomycetota bacterium]|jgi:Xaa-Pro aminopeptidase
MESWPETSPEYRIDGESVRKNITAIRALMAEHDLDGLVINSADRYQNEYTPLEDNHRYELSGFTGSTALLLVPANDRVKLYVDGRYHLQADQEVDAELIEVVKVQFSVSVAGALFCDLKGMGRVGYEGDRITIKFAQSIEETVDTSIVFSAGEVGDALGRPPLLQSKPIQYIPDGIAGCTTKEKLATVFEDIPNPENTALLLTALDDIAWLADARGYHFAYQSSFAAVAVARPGRIDIAVDPDVKETTIDRELIRFTTDDPSELLCRSDAQSITTLQYDPNQVTKATLESIMSSRPDLELRPSASPVVGARALKNASEIRHMEASNARSARAINNTIRWVRQQFAAGEPVTELGYYEAANGFYEAEGARDLSFHTIAAVGPNTAIIHFSNPSGEVTADASDFMLLDSGALYEGGMATDITRCFVAGGKLAKPTDRQKKIYTLVLKGVLRGMMAVFPTGTRGSFIDSVVRAPLYDAGFNFAHGTGHGVGIHVHEPGVGISPSYQGIIRPGHVCSVEPGIYIEGFGGVRHENVVVFEEHPDKPGFIRSRPLNFVGFDTYLLDASLLNEQELGFFTSYMDECHKRGTATFE